MTTDSNVKVLIRRRQRVAGFMVLGMVGARSFETASLCYSLARPCGFCSLVLAHWRLARLHAYYLVVLLPSLRRRR
jgi:hypothetical protein